MKRSEMEITSTDLLGKTEAIVHMANGGQVFRIGQRDRFFYKIEEGKLMCRVNECGGWHPSVPLRDTDKLYVATVDWKIEGWGRDMRTVTVPLLCPTFCGELDNLPNVSNDVSEGSEAVKYNFIDTE